MSRKKRAAGAFIGFIVSMILALGVVAIAIVINADLLYVLVAMVLLPPVGTIVGALVGA